MNKKYSKFIVTSVHDLFNKKFGNSEDGPLFSCILPFHSKLCNSAELVDGSTFFRLKFDDWPANSTLPYGKLID
jgi:hypothetical protein